MMNILQHLYNLRPEWCAIISSNALLPHPIAKMVLLANVYICSGNPIYFNLPSCMNDFMFLKYRHVNMLIFNFS